ncbi:MAG: AAA family ATPase [Deltaproteobacteria bacterium]|nr:AAA family ATPase [Deltaproteobacteria bacterium]
MGKFFKALEKAAKDSVARSSQQPADKRVRSKIKPAAPQAKNRSVVWSDDQHGSPDLARKDMEPVEPSPDARTSVRLDPPPPVHPSLPVVEPIAPPRDRRSNHRLEKNAGYDNTLLKVEPPKPPVEPKSALRTDQGPKPDGLNIALVKPEAADLPRSVEQFDREPEVGQRNVKTAESGDTLSRNVVRVRYSKTKVQVNDPEKLRNNKIFSVFDEMEMTDQIKILQTQILKKLKSIGGNTILVTSANPYEGKTFTSINLGVSIAKEFDRTVLIIDADLRKPTKKHTAFSTEFFSLNVEKGLADYLMGEVEIPDILINPGIAKLTLIPGGRPVVNAPELLNSLRMEEMMVEIKSRYSSDRLVIVDGPAILPFPDATILSRYVDGVLPVVEVERTSKEDLKKMMDRLNGTRVLGTVLNKNRG